MTDFHRDSKWKKKRGKYAERYAKGVTVEVDGVPKPLTKKQLAGCTVHVKEGESLNLSPKKLEKYRNVVGTDSTVEREDITKTAWDKWQKRAADEQKQKEMVNHPSHYAGGGIEVIDVIEAWKLNFHLGNAVKYIARAGKKGDLKTDLEKAKWYLQRELDRLK